jgi:hypothetical protein
VITQTTNYPTIKNIDRFSDRCLCDCLLTADCDCTTKNPKPAQEAWLRDKKTTSTVLDHKQVRIAEAFL